MKTRKLFHLPLSNTILFIVFITALCFTNISMAKSQVVPLEGISYSINASMMDNLNRLNGKKVTITLASGKVLTGMIKSVGSHLLHLEKLQGKEFYDALIRIEDITSIETRFRTMKR